MAVATSATGPTVAASAFRSALLTMPVETDRPSRSARAARDQAFAEAIATRQQGDGRQETWAEGAGRHARRQGGAGGLACRSDR